MSSESISSTSTGYRLWLADRGIHFDLPDADDAPRGGSVSVGGGNLFDGGTLRDASATQNINNFNLVSENVCMIYVTISETQEPNSFQQKDKNKKTKISKTQEPLLHDLSLVCPLFHFGLHMSWSAAHSSEYSVNLS